MSLSVYHVSYEIHSSSEADRAGFVRELESTPKKQILESSCLIETEETAKKVFTRLARHLGMNDRIFITQVTPNYAGWILSAAWTWLNRVR